MSFKSLSDRVEEEFASASRLMQPEAPLSGGLFTGYRRLNLDTESLEYISAADRASPLAFKEVRRDQRFTELDAWQTMYPREILEKVVQHHQDHHQEEFRYGSRGAIEISEKSANIYYATRIFLLSGTTGHRGTATRQDSGHTQRLDFCRARAALSIDGGTGLGVNALERYHANFFIPQELESAFNSNFLKPIWSLGEHLAGDEKAFGGLHQAPSSKKCDHKVRWVSTWQD